MMAEDMAEKKLRGSGGFAIAKITDEEQKRGNLGGPELFLAGIGRLDEDRFMKYFCNKCEKEYEGAPSIVYENPNEELGEGVTLIEKGEYKCKTCNSTIAQYRKFDAPATTATTAPQVSNEVQQTSKEEGEGGGEQKESNPTSLDISISPSPPTARAIATGSFMPVMSLVGMSAYDSEAMMIGKVDQIGLRREGSNAQIVIKVGDKEIPWGGISKIGDIILVKTASEEQQRVPSLSSSSSTVSSVKCPSCGYQNEAGALFCEECGAKLT